MTDLEKLIQSQAKLTERIEGLLARDPSKEFTYGEGNVGAAKRFGPCPEMEECKGILSGNSFVFSTQLYIQFWSIRALMASAGGTPSLKFEFDDNDQFTRPQAYYTSGLIVPGVLWNVCEIIPLRKRFLRITAGTIATTFAQWTPVAFTGPYTYINRFSVNVFGE